MGIVGLVAAGEADADTGFAGGEEFGNFGKDLGLDVSGDGLGDFPQCGLGDIHADGGAIVFDSEPEFAGAMLVEYGGDGIQAFAQLGEAFFELDGFGFVHFKSGSARRKAWGWLILGGGFWMLDLIKI